MIKFFRKIRQKLLSENKFSKYLIYAIGEIVLVVIGILIALSVNNWNENRKLQNKSQEYLERLEDDLVNDITLIESRIEYWSAVSKYGKRALMAADGIPENSTAWEILCNFYHASQVNFLEVQGTTYDEIKSSGNLGLLSNIELRNKLSDYYRRASGNSQAVWGQIPEYRVSVRRVLPIEFQEYYFENCYTIYDTKENHFSKSCKPLYREARAKDIISNITDDEETINSLRYWITEMGIAIELADKHKALTHQLIQLIALEKNEK